VDNSKCLDYCAHESAAKSSRPIEKSDSEAVGA
jgi:hypothetical protein